MERAVLTEVPLPLEAPHLHQHQMRALELRRVGQGYTNLDRTSRDAILAQEFQNRRTSDGQSDFGDPQPGRAIDISRVDGGSCDANHVWAAFWRGSSAARCCVG